MGTEELLGLAGLVVYLLIRAGVNYMKQLAEAQREEMPSQGQVYPHGEPHHRGRAGEQGRGFGGGSPPSRGTSTDPETKKALEALLAMFEAREGSSGVQEGERVAARVVREGAGAESPRLEAATGPVHRPPGGNLGEEAWKGEVAGRLEAKLSDRDAWVRAMIIGDALARPVARPDQRWGG